MRVWGDAHAPQHPIPAASIDEAQVAYFLLCRSQTHGDSEALCHFASVRAQIVETDDALVVQVVNDQLPSAPRARWVSGAMSLHSVASCERTLA